MRLAIAAFALMGALASLSARAADLPETLFSAEPMRFAASSLDVDDVMARPLDTENPDPAGIVHQWAAARVATTGDPGALKLTILVSEFREEEMEMTDGVEGWFTSEPDRRYTARLSAQLSYEGPLGTASVEVSVENSVEVSEDEKPSDREAVKRNMLRKLGLAFDRRMEDQIRAHMKHLLRY
jgi:hypothetical protein